MSVLSPLTALDWNSRVANFTDHWSLWILCWGLCIMAYLTNPSAASFRTHLTSLSFHTHLRRLSSSDESRPINLNEGTPSDSPKTLSKKKKPSHQHTTPDPPHVLSFSNRISLSVRTPPFTLQSYYLFSTVIMAPPALRKSSASMAISSLELAWKERLEGGIWIGAFGGWYAWKWDGETPEEEARLARLKKGVLAMEVDDPVEEINVSTPIPTTKPTTLPSEPDTTTLSPPKPANSNRSSRPSKRGFRPGQQPPTTLARLRSTQAEASSNSISAPPDTTSTPSPISPSKNTSDLFVQKEPPPSPVAVPPHQHGSVPGPYNITPPSVEISLPPAESGADPPNQKIVDELQSQLEELKETSLEIETRLRKEFEEISERKKREEKVKLELKARTKALEEEKRLAELKRIEAEKELTERKGVVKSVLERVERLQNEISQIERKELEVIERKEKKKRDRKERERKLKDDVVKKKDELRLAELGIAKLLGKVTGLEKTIDVRREMLIARRNDLASRNLGFMSNGNGMRQIGPYGGYTHSMPSSRPSSVRSGHMDHYSTPFDPASFMNPTSAPSSPTSSFVPVSSDDDPYHDGNFYSGPFAPDTYQTRHSHSSSSGGMSRTFAPFSPPLEETAQSFQPFDFESNDPVSEELRHHSRLNPRHVQAQHSHSQSHDEYLSRRPVLPLPLQYLVTTEQSSSAIDDIDSSNGALSPMTPRQTSLIPSQLFQMLDEDDEDDFVMAQSHSPSPRYAAANLSTAIPSNELGWSGLQLAVNANGEDHSDTAGVELDRRRTASASPVTRSPLIDTVTYGYSSPVLEKAATPAGPGGINTRSPTGLWDLSYVGAGASSADHGKYSPEDPDDLPRQGLSLNPDAKAFAFRHFGHSSSGSNPPGSSSLDSPLVSCLFNSVGVDPPAKSRMDFSTTSTSSRLTPPSRLSPVGGAIGTGFEWQAATSPRVVAPTTTAAATTSMSFNPFDDGDDLLGPLKR